MKHLRELDGLRGIMSLWVVLGHVLAALPAMSRLFPNSLYNYNAVHVFIILSGFAIFSMIDHGFPSYGRYLVGRVCRIFPVYLVVLLVSTLTLGFSENVLQVSPIGVATDGRIHIIEIAKSDLAFHVASHIPLLQGIFPPALFPYSSVTLVGQAWSLSVEWQFYLIAPLLFLITTSLSKVWACFAALALVAASWLIGLHMDAGFVGNNLPMFAAGFFSYFFYKYGISQLSTKQRVVALVSSILLILIFLPGYALPLGIWTVSLFSIVSTKVNGSKNLVHSALSSKISTYLGRISYPLYMVHMQVLFACMWMTNKLGASTAVRFAVLPIISIALSIVVAGIVHQMVESPFHRLGRRISRRPAKQGERLGAA